MYEMLCELNVDESCTVRSHPQPRIFRALDYSHAISGARITHEIMEIMEIMDTYGETPSGAVRGTVGVMGGWGVERHAFGLCGLG